MIQLCPPSASSNSLLAFLVIWLTWVGTERETQFPNKLKHSDSDQPEYDSTSKRGGATGIPEGTSRWPATNQEEAYQPIRQVQTGKPTLSTYMPPNHPSAKQQYNGWLLFFSFFSLEFSLQIFDSSVKYTNQSNSTCSTKKTDPTALRRRWYMTNSKIGARSGHRTGQVPTLAAHRHTDPTKSSHS
jgi:hypothetical protein